MTDLPVATLADRGFTPIIAYSQPYSLSPHLRVPSFQLFGKRVGVELRSRPGLPEVHAMGAWLPQSWSSPITTRPHMLVEWPDGRREALLFVIEEETETDRFTIHRLAHYCLDLAEMLAPERVVPVVIFLRLG